MKDIVIKNVHEHLVSCGFSVQNSLTQAGKAWQFFQKQICNSRDPFKDACDFAGGQAVLIEPKIKYKSPKAKSKPRTKKPQEAFNFGGAHE
ncbi:hypothetical protein CTH30272_02122 [Allocatenococcus thiocycli]|nr:hypothetical protein CTH30272_02122 [Catenococcus thiocycli]